MVLGSLIEKPDGHLDIVGYQCNKQVQQDGSQTSNRIRWVRKVGATNHDFVVKGSGPVCEKDCRPTAKEETV